MNISLLGKSLACYSILYDSAHAAASTVASYLQKWLRARCGAALPLCTTAPADASGILIRPLPHAAYGEGALCAQNGSILVQGNDVVGLCEAAARLVDVLSNAKTDICAAALDFHTTLPPREAYEKNADGFLPCYHRAQAAPGADLSLAEKHRALNDPTGRPFVIAHRGEHVFYPENSLECALSAWRGGADAVEVDIQKSADGVWVCMHDADVTRTTNAADLLGTAGYPISPRLCDWTLAQLRTLRLTDAYGALTPFPIPTLEEILRACDGRIFLHLDKAFSVAQDIFPFMEQVGVFDCVYLVNHVAIEDILLLKDHFAERGIRLNNLTRPRRSRGQTAPQILPTILENLPHVTPAVIPHGDYVDHDDEITALVARYRDRVRFGAWFLRDFDYEALWQKARAEGISIFMTDHPLDLIALRL